MSQEITLQAQAMTAQAERQGVQGKNPPASTMTSRLSHLTRMNSLSYTGPNIAEDLEKDCRVSMVYASMGLHRLMVHVQQVEESKKRKHTRVGNKSRQNEKIK